MSRICAEEFGIAVPERAIGIAAHDVWARRSARPELRHARDAARGVADDPSRWMLR